MAVTAYKFAGTVATVADADSTGDWTNPNNVKVDDTNFATISGGKSDIPYYIRLSNFGFSSSDIPTGATIDGYDIIVSRYSTTTNGSSDIKFYLRNASGQTGNNFYSATKWPTSEGQATYGGSTEKFGTTLVQSDIVATTFGLDFKTKLHLTDGQYINYIKIRVYYTAGGGSTVFLPNIMKHNFIPPLIGGY